MRLLYASQGREGKGAAYDLLAHALKSAHGLEKLPELAKASGGKPYFPSRPDLHFSLSHAGPYALCALGDGPVGADIEPVVPRRPFLPRRALSEREYSWFLERGACWEDFYSLWTLKESYCKYTGQGISRPPRTIEVPLLEPGEEQRLKGLWFKAFGGGGWRAAVCAKGRIGAIIWI